MIDYEQILNKPAFQALEPERREAFRRLMQRIDGKSTMEVMGAVMAFSKDMPKGRDLSKEEQAAMTEALYESLDDNDRQKLASIMKMVDKMNWGKK